MPRWNHRRQAGQALVETSMVIGILLIIILGGITFIGYGNDTSVVTRAATEGANSAALTGGDTATVRTTVDTALRGGGLDPARATVSMDWPQGEGRYLPVQVTVRYAAQGLAGGAFGLPATRTIVRAFARASEVDGTRRGPSGPGLPGSSRPGGAP